MFSRTIALSVGLASALSLVAIVAYAATSAQDFVTEASIANEFEIQTSKLALEKSQNKDIKSFAQDMINDHGKAGDKLKITLEASSSHAQPAKALDEKHQAIYDQLNGLSADAFNSKYIAVQTDAHKEAVSLFSDYSKNGTDDALKMFATDMLPALKEHLSHVQKLKIN